MIRFYKEFTSGFPVLALLIVMGLNTVDFLYSQTDVVNKKLLVKEISDISQSDSILPVLKNMIEFAQESETLESIINEIIDEVSKLKNTGYYLNATEIILGTIQYLSDESNEIYIARCRIALAEVCRASMQYDLAHKNANEALSILYETNHQIEIANCYNRIAAIFYEQKEKEKSLDYCNRSLTIAKELNDELLIASNYEIFGVLQRDKGELQKALELFHEAYNTYDDRKDTIAKTNILFNIMLVYQRKGNSDSVFYYARKAYENAEITGVQSQKFYATNYLAKIYADRKDWESAYEYELKAKILKNELFRQVEAFQIKRLHAEYKSAQQELKIEKQNELLIKEKHKKRIFAVVVIGLAIIILLLINFYILKHRSEERITKQNSLLKKQKDQIEKQAKELKLQNVKLIELGQFKDSMMNMVVHDLKNPLSAMITLSQVSATEEMLPLISQSARQMLNLVLNILDINRYENAELKLVFSNENILSIYNEALKETEYFLKEKKLVVKCDIPENIIVNIDKKLIKRVFINLFDNSIKYSPEGGQITTGFNSEQKNKITIHVMNEGPSIPSKHHQTIFKKYAQVGQYDKTTVKSTGLGLTFCKLVVEAHGGEIGVNSSGEIGADFWFTIPTSIEKE